MHVVTGNAQAAHRGLGERLRKGAMPDGGCGFNCVSLLVKPGDATLAPMLPVRAVGVWLLVLVSGCRTPIQWDGVQRGMSRAEVVRAMGEPEMTRQEGSGVELLFYRLPRRGRALVREECFVRLQEGKVIEYGLLEGRGD
jgi:hypothetical protein